MAIVSDGLSPAASLEFYAWLSAATFDREWRAYRAGQGGGASFRRRWMDPAFELQAVINVTQRHLPEVAPADPDETKFARFSLGLDRYNAAKLSREFREWEDDWIDALPGDADEDKIFAIQTALALVVPLYHRLLGWSPAEAEALMSLKAQLPAPNAIEDFPWARRAHPTLEGHPPTVKLWSWLSSVAETTERRLAQRGSPGEKSPEQAAGLLKMRALRMLMSDLWSLLPGGDWKDELDATWLGLKKGLSIEAALIFERGIRQAAENHRARGAVHDAALATLHERAAAVMRESFTEMLPAPLATGAAVEPRSLQWNGMLCVSGLMMWGPDPLIRENFIRQVQRGLGLG